MLLYLDDSHTGDDEKSTVMRMGESSFGYFSSLNPGPRHVEGESEHERWNYRQELYRILLKL
jgi:hypothetical protein